MAREAAEEGRQAIFFKAWPTGHFLKQKQGASPTIKARISQFRRNAAKNSLVRGRIASRLYIVEEEAMPWD
jgi:hypothetical protein